MVFFIIALCCFVLIPQEALAWGIGVHLQLGSGILSNLESLPPALGALLGANPYDYLYGCISADITLGKKFTHYLKHCHSWRMGEEILAAAATDSQQACAYGYLAHLAADTVAHSYFVPYRMVRTFNTVMLKHTYWEMRFEARVEPGDMAAGPNGGAKKLQGKRRPHAQRPFGHHFFFRHQQAALQLPADADPPPAVAEDASFALQRLASGLSAEENLEEYLGLAREAAAERALGDGRKPLLEVPTRRGSGRSTPQG